MCKWAVKCTDSEQATQKNANIVVSLKFYLVHLC